MIDEKTRKQIEAYIPSPRDKSLRPYCDYYVNQNDRVKLGHVRELFETDDGDDLIGLVDDRGRQIHGLWEFDSFRRCELYDNETDCRNQTHGAYDDWEALRKVQDDKYGHLRDRTLKRVGKTMLFTPDGMEPIRHITHWMPLPEPPKGESND